MGERERTWSAVSVKYFTLRTAILRQECTSTKKNINSLIGGAESFYVSVASRSYCMEGVRQVYRVDTDSAGLKVRLDLLSPAVRCNILGQHFSRAGK